jgi:hypothetical protein
VWFFLFCKSGGNSVLPKKFANASENKEDLPELKSDWLEYQNGAIV